MQTGENSQECSDVEFPASNSPKPSLTQEQAIEIIDRTPAHLIIQVLSQKDFAAARSRVFAGFRTKPESLKTALARGRLITEITASNELAEKFRDVVLTISVRKPPYSNPVRSTIKPAQSAPARSDLTAKISLLNSEVRQIRTELKDAQEATSAIQMELDRQKASDVGLSKKLDHQSKLIEWNERLRTRLENEIRTLRSNSKTKKHETAGGPRTHFFTESKAVAGSFALSEAVDRLITKGKLDAAEQVLNEALKVDPIDNTALRLRATLAISQNDKSAAFAYLSAGFNSSLKAGEYSDATALLFRSATVSQDQSKALAEQLFTSLAKNSQGIPLARKVLDSITETRSYMILMNWCREPLKSALFEAKTSINVSRTLSSAIFEKFQFNGIETITPSSLVNAIDSGDIKTVTLARAVVSNFDKNQKSEFDQAIRTAGDESYVRTLTLKSLMGAAVIDASNVAYYEQEYLSNSKPAIANIMAVRRAVRWSGYFPIIVIADANLPFVIDSPSQLRAMAHNGKLELVNSGTDADEVIVREAFRRSAIIVTNDYMADWDKDDMIHKVQFSISLTNGSATLFV